MQRDSSGSNYPEGDISSSGQKEKPRPAERRPRLLCDGWPCGYHPAAMLAPLRGHKKRLIVDQFFGSAPGVFLVGSGVSGFNAPVFLVVAGGVCADFCIVRRHAKCLIRTRSPRLSRVFGFDGCSGQNEHCDCQSCSSMFHLWRPPWGTKLRSPGTFWLMPTGAPANQPSVRHAGPGLLAEPSTVLMSVMLKKEEARRGNAYLAGSQAS
jgi:hypothetical protein